MQGTNVDLGHHLLLGKITVEERYVPQTNLISFTHPEYVFVNNQWLSEVVFYFIHSVFGFNGLIIFADALMMAVFALLFSISKERVAAGIAGIFLLQNFIDRTEVKPELFSYILLSLFLYVLYHYKKKFTKLIFLLPPLMAFWINFHIFFIVGIAVIGLFYLDSLSTKKDRFSKKSNTLFIVLIISTLSTLLNPNFLKGVIYPFHVLTNYGFEVIENYNFFHAISKGYIDITFFYFVLTVIFLWAGAIITRRKIQQIDVLLIVLFTFLSFFAVRNFTLLTLGGFIPLVRIYSLLIDLVEKKFKKNAGQIKRGIGLIVICLAIPGVFVNLSIHGVGLGIIDNGSDAMDFIKNNDIKGPIYNNYNIGNYLEYRLYPKERVFVDGNPEQYPEDFFKEVYYPMENSFDKFREYSDKYKINLVVYEHKNQTKDVNPLLLGLTNSPDWRMIYLNELLVIYVRNAPINSKVLENSITENNVKVEKINLQDKEKIADLSNFFRIIKWYKPMIEMDLAYLDLDPRSCISLRHVSTFIPSYVQQYQLYCK